MATLFSDAQMAWFRSYFARLACKDDCLIERVTTSTPDGIGSAAGGLATIGTVKADVVQPSAGLLAEYANEIGSQLTWQVVFPFGTDVRKKDRLTVTGKTMLVQALIRPDTWAAFTGVLASEVV